MNSSTKNGNGQTRVLPEKQGVPYEVGNKRPPRHTQFKPGVSGNPGGVRKGTVFVSERMKYLQSLPLEEFAAYEPQTVADEIAKTRVENARSAKVRGLAETKELLDRTEGKAPVKVDISSTTLNINVQVQLFIDGARDLASRYQVPVQLAAERMLALAPANLRPVLEAALVDGDASRD